MTMTRYWLRLVVIVALCLALCVQGAVLAGNMLALDHEFIYSDGDRYTLMSAERGLRITSPEFVLNRGPVSWTPDGAYITYFRVDTYFVMDVATRNVTSEVIFDSTTATTDTPIWSTNGQYAVIKTYTQVGEFTDALRLQLLTVDETYQITDVQPIFEGDAFFPVWSPDGTRVAFVESFSSSGTNSAVYIYDTQTNTLSSHTINTLSTFRVYWWDELHIVFVREDGIYRIDLTTDISTLLWDTGYNPLPARNHWQISPDRTRLIFDGGLYAVSEASTEIERITDIDSATEWSEDGEYLLMMITHVGGSCAGTFCASIVTLDLVLGDPNGNLRSEIVTGLSVMYFNWRP